ncbi:MAG: HNH endonuclease [Pseudorhodobacter sp.]|nr:HNH endonuclease [Frankiaceae bacterium]
MITALGLIADGAGSPTRQSVVYVHLNEDQVADPAARPHAGPESRLGLVEKHGPLSVERITGWLSGSPGSAGVRISVRPVLDLNRTDTVDGHDPPPWMRELVILRDGECVFPFCERDARACDLDHIRAFVTADHGGPPGQTSPKNLAPLCRRHHRAKTHGGWTYMRRRDGAYAWTDPHGHTHVTTPTPKGPEVSSRAGQRSA